MTKGPLGQALEEITGGILKEAVEGYRNPPAPAVGPRASCRLPTSPTLPLEAISLVKRRRAQLAGNQER